MSYALIENGAVVQYPYTYAMLRSEYPNVSFPRVIPDDRLEEHGLFKVAEVEQPAHDPITQNVEEGTPTLLAGVWTQTWNVVAASAEEIAARQQAAADDAAELSVKADAFVTQFIAMTPEQVSTYVANNTANLAEFRALITKITIMLLILAKRSLR